MITACSKAGCYAVLASLSGRYPPLEGRSPTCYSPVRHSVIHCWITAFDLHVLGTPPALILSQDQTLMLNALFTAFAPCGAPTDRNFLTRSPVDLALALFSYFVFGEWSIRLATNSHPLTLDGRPPSRLCDASADWSNSPSLKLFPFRSSPRAVGQTVVVVLARTI